MLHSQVSWASSIMPASIINTYGQLYEVSEVFPVDQWISVPAVFTLVMIGSPVPPKEQLNVLTHPNAMHLFAYVTASGQVTIFHCLMQRTT
jgi:hypothetical protein